MKIPESELIINGDGSVFHLHIRPDQLAGTVFLVGDPGRVRNFKSFFTSLECEGESREFVWATGIYKGTKMTVLSSGIGTDNIDIVMTELDALANIDFDTREVKPVHKALDILRVGTCGAIQPEIPLGSYILSHISVGFDGLMNWYEGRETFALQDFEDAFVKHMSWNPKLPAPYFVRASQKIIDRLAGSTVKGMTVSAPGFYGPQGRVVRQGLVMPDMLRDLESFEFDGYKITNFEMEGSALAGMSAKLGHNAATVCFAIAHRYHKDANTDYKKEMDKFVRTVLGCMTN